MSLVRSKQRVADHGEVFTPAWLVEGMLDLVKDETERTGPDAYDPAGGRWVLIGLAIAVFCMATASYWPLVL